MIAAEKRDLDESTENERIEFLEEKIRDQNKIIECYEKAGLAIPDKEEEERNVFVITENESVITKDFDRREKVVEISSPTALLKNKKALADFIDDYVEYKRISLEERKRLGNWKEFLEEFLNPDSTVFDSSFKSEYSIRYESFRKSKLRDLVEKESQTRLKRRS